MMDALQDTEPPDRRVMTGPGVIAACEACGQDAAIEIEGLGWCAACLHARGSCCGASEKGGGAD